MDPQIPSQPQSQTPYLDKLLEEKRKLQLARARKIVSNQVWAGGMDKPKVHSWSHGVSVCEWQVPQIEPPGKLGCDPQRCPLLDP